MIHLKFSPEWFYLPSTIIDFFSFIVIISISLISLRYYRLNKLNKKYYYLAFSFFLVGMSFLFKLITNLTVYYDQISPINNPEIIKTTVDTIISYNIFSYLTFAAFTFLNLLGLYYLYSVYNKEQPKSSIFLIAYFILITTYFSQLNYYIFHLTALILLGLITTLYIKKYQISKYPNTKGLAYSFGIIAISQLLFIFTKIGNLFYVAGEIIQLGGYALLLLIIKKVLNDGKKTK
ncbi:hypothetical protein K8R33_05240 [archaeon]|nr:hypothetical protein [archaeon]